VAGGEKKKFLIASRSGASAVNRVIAMKNDRYLMCSIDQKKQDMKAAGAQTSRPV
jgi:hypothetical protein